MKILSLFSGCGGMDLGFRQAGHEIIAAYDSMPLAVENYRMNLGVDIHLAELNEGMIDDIPDSELILGGPPCQSLSIANHNADWDSPHNLVPLFLKIVARKRPRLFVMENVPGIRRFSKQLGQALDRLDSYHVLCKILDASRYGVPQERRRFFIIGVRGGWPLLPAPTHTRSSTVTTRAAIGNLLLEPEIELPPYMAHLKNSGDILIHSNNRPGPSRHKPQRQPYFRSVDRPAFTLLAGESSAHHRAQISGQVYLLKAQHLSSLQSFPADWKWPEGIVQTTRLIGNSVPPRLAYHLGQAIASL